MAKDDRYWELVTRRDSSARLCAASVLADDLEYAKKYAQEFKEADDELRPTYEAASKRE